MKEKLIITGSEGLIGTELAKYLSTKYKILKLDYLLGHELSDEVFVETWFKENQAEYLVNCFAINDHVDANSQESTLFSVSLDSVRKFLEINVISLFSVCREFARNKKSKGIVNFSSTYGVVSPIPSLYKNGEKHIGYSLSKASVPQLTRHLAVHLAPQIRVNCIVPGGVKHNQEKSFTKAYSKLTPFNRMMEKHELNGLLKYLCSDESSYMTGSIIANDGGWTAW